MEAPTGRPLGTDPTRPTPGLCGCGCGEPTPRRYRPGHDAKHHSTLAAALTSGDWRIEARAADLLADLGWTSYADRAALRAVPYRASNGIAAQHIADVATWQVTPSGQHHCNRRCPALTAEARAAGRLNRVTRLAADSWVTLTPNTPELAARLASSWDQCTTCSTDSHRDEAAERHEMTVAIGVEAISPTDPKGPNAKAKRARGWTIAPDLPGQRPTRVTIHPDGTRTSSPDGDPLPMATWAAPAA